MCELSQGSLDKIMNGPNIEQPVLQLLNYNKSFDVISDQFIYTLIVSDGVKKLSTVLSTELSYLFETGKFAKYAVFKMLNYKIMSVEDKRRKVLKIMDCEVLIPAKEVQNTIGNPIEIENSVEVNKPHTSTAVHHEVAIMADFMQPNISKSTNNLSYEEPTVPIKTLDFQNRKAIKARVINKFPIRDFKNGNGKLFYAYLADDSGKIRCVAFNKACDQFYNKLEYNKIYRISNYDLRRINDYYYDIEITMETKIE